MQNNLNAAAKPLAKKYGVNVEDAL